VTPLLDLVGKVDVALGLVFRKVKFLGNWRVSLATTIAIVLIVVGARYYYSFVTGYIVPDEAWYYNTFILDKAPISSYRPAFLAIFLLFFHGVDDVSTFLLRGALYSAIWAVGCVVMFLIILRRLKVTESTLSLLIVSLPLFPVFVVLVPAILTETPGLFFALVGIYFALRQVQEKRALDSLLAGVFIVLAYEVREPYLLFAIGNIVLFLALSLKRRSLGTVVGYAIAVSLVFPVPVRLQPLQFTQPVHILVTDLVSRMFSQGSFPVTSLTPTLIPGFAMPITLSLQPDLFWAFAIGLTYGFNPLFAMFAVLSLVAVNLNFFRKRSSATLFLALNAIWSLGAFAVSAAASVLTLYGALTEWTSVIIRASHVSLPGIVGFSSIYRRLGVRTVAVLMLALVVGGSTQIGVFANAFQRSLSREPVDRLSLDYRAPYYRLYLLAKDSGKTLVFGGAHMRGIRMYMTMLANVTLVSVGVVGQPYALNETEFEGWLEQEWDAIFLYDDWVTIDRVDVYPQFYSEILQSRRYSGYFAETVWVDNESYALKMVKECQTAIVP